MRRWPPVVTLLVLTALMAVAAPASAAPAVVPRPLCCIPTGSVDAIAVSGNTAYVGGTFHRMGRPTHHFAVLDPTSGDTQTGLPGVDGGYILASAPDGNGGWYVGGSFTSIGGVERGHLAHILADKSIDPNWTPSTNGQVNALVRAFGVVYVGGSFSDVNGGTARADMAAFDATGAVTDFTADTDGSVNALGWSSRFTDMTFTTTVSRLYIGGSFATVDGAPRNNLAATDLAGNVVGAANPNVGGPVTSIAVRRDSATSALSVYVGGNFTTAGAGNTSRGNGARFNEDTDTLDPTWNPQANSAITSLALGSDAVYLGGAFSHLGINAHTRVGKVDRTNGTADPGFNAAVTGNFQPRIESVVLLGDALYVGGRFDHANTTIERSDLVAFDSATGAVTSWDPDPPGLNHAVQYLGSDGTSLLASGEFETIGGPERQHVAAIDLSTGQLTSFNPNLDNRVNALAIQGNTLYAGGTFQTVGGSTSRHNAAAFDLTTGALTAFDPNLNGEVLSLAPAGGTVILGGSFSQVGGAPRQRVAEVDAQSGAATEFRPDPDGPVAALAVSGDIVFAGGDFTDFGGADRQGLAAVRLVPGTLGAVTPFSGGLNSFGTVRTLLLRGSTLYVSGSFSQLGGVLRQGYGALDTGTSLPTLFAPSGASNFATGLAASETDLFAAGQFNQIGGTSRPGLVSLDPQTGAVTDWQPPVPASPVMSSVGVSPNAGVLAGGESFAVGSAQGILLSFALPPSTPAAPQATAGDSQATVSFDAPPNGGSPITQYKVTASPGGQTATGSGSPITVPSLTNGTAYTFTLSATNAAGESLQSPASNSVTPGAPTSPVTGPGPGAGTSVALSATGFRVTNKRFRVAKRRTVLNALARKGTTFVFRLSADATSRIAIARKLPGRKKGTRCVAPRKTLKKRCTRYVKAGTLVRKRTKAGANRVPFSGRMGKRALRPGTYRATLRASDASGRRSAPVSLTFRVVRR